MAASVASPIERQFSTIAGISSMTSIVVARHHADHHPVRPQPQHRRRGARRADRAFGSGEQPAGRNDDAAELPQGQSGRLPGPATSACAPTPCRCRRSTNTPRRCWRRSISQMPGVAQVLVYGAQKFAVRVQVDPVAAAARNISLDDVRSVVAATNSNAPVGTLQGEQQNVTLLATGAMRQGGRLPKRRRGLSQRRAGQARRDRQRRSTASRTTRSRAGSTASAPSCWRSSASPTPTRSRWSTRCGDACRRSARRFRRPSRCSR